MATTIFRTNYQKMMALEPNPKAYENWLIERFKEQKKAIGKDIQEAVELLSKQINSWGNVPFLEIEARLGYFEDDDDDNVKLPFDSNVDKENFEKIKNALSEWDEVIEITECSSVVYFVEDNIRMEVTSDGSRSAVRKKKLEHSNFRYDNSPFDLRVSFSAEIPVDIDTVKNASNCVKRNKQRTSYHMNHWRFDLTVVTYMENSIENREYQVEIEAKLENIPYIDYVYMADSLMLKVKKLVNICEKEEEGSERDMVPLSHISKKFQTPESLTNLLSNLKI
tara:strand:- start:10739 stop:11578 length:840 start_codon:yes stop_codon:yes gene_type:complete